jgi:tRNA threonylcarbamoyladenosine biosynthesis protein TsaB
MYSLLIETSTEQGLLAILKDHQLIFQGNLPSGYQNSKHLLPEIERGLKLLNFQVKDFKYIAVGIGPGSYTGIRIGAITAKTLAFAAKLPLIGLCTLELWTPSEDGQFAVLIDAKIGGAYVITGQWLHGVINYFSPPQLLELNKLGEILDPVEVILTPKRTPVEEKLKALYPQNSWKWEEKGPDLLQMDTLAYNKYLKGDYSSDGQLEILYMRKTQAEIEQDLKKP